MHCDPQETESLTKLSTESSNSKFKRCYTQLEKTLILVLLLAFIFIAILISITVVLLQKDSSNTAEKCVPYPTKESVLQSFQSTTEVSEKESNSLENDWLSISEGERLLEDLLAKKMAEKKDEVHSDFDRRFPRSQVRSRIARIL